MRVQKKIILLLTTIVVLFLLGVISVQFFAFQDIQSIQGGREEILLRLFKNIVTLKGQPLQQIVHDYSRWEEMVEFANHRDDQWAKENLESIMPKYHIEVLWVFDANGSLTYTHSIAHDLKLIKSIDAKNIPSMFENQQYVHFYCLTDQGILEIRGAALHKKRIIEDGVSPEGYLFVGHIWDSYYIDGIASLIAEGKVKTTRRSGYDKTPYIRSDEFGNLCLTLHFRSWDGTPIQRLLFEINAPLVKKYVDASTKSFLTATAIWFMVFLFNAWGLIAWVYRPLKKISRFLTQEDPRAVQSLLKDPSEFGHISRLMIEFFQQKEQLKFCANHDALTGLLNRGAIMGFIHNEFSRAKRHGAPFSVIMIDLDHFKRVNDTYGHLSGDIVLKEVAARLRSELRTNDMIGRYGGEEFIVLVPGDNAEEAVHLAKRLKDKIADQEITLPDHSIRMTASMGISDYRSEIDQSCDTLLVRADSALYHSKENGRNQITIQ